METMLSTYDQTKTMTQIYLYSDDIATIKSFVLSSDESVDDVISLDDEDHISDFELLSESESESESDLSSSSEESIDSFDEDEKDMKFNVNLLEAKLSSYQKIDFEFFLRGLVILCIYSIAHGSFFECFSCILEAITPYLTWNKNLLMFLSAICFASLTGSFRFYINFMDDKDETMYRKKKKMREERKDILRLLEEDSKKSLIQASMAKNKLLAVRIHLFQWKTKIQKKLRRIPTMTAFLDLIIFYCTYLSCTTVLYTNMVKPNIEIPKVALYNGLPSTQYNVTEGIHPSVITRYLVEGIKLENMEYGKKFTVHENLSRILQETIDAGAGSNNDDIESTKCLMNDGKGNGGSQQCTIDSNNSNNVDSKNKSSKKEGWLTNNDDKGGLVDASSHLIAFQELEAKWTLEDYEWISTQISPASAAEFFGNYETSMVTCKSYFLSYVGILAIAISIMPLFGISPGNIFE